VTPCRVARVAGVSGFRVSGCQVLLGLKGRALCRYWPAASPSSRPVERTEGAIECKNGGNYLSGCWAPQVCSRLNGVVPVLVEDATWEETAEQLDDIFIGDAEIW
jgi:hypothetical protein